MKKFWKFMEKFSCWLQNRCWKELGVSKQYAICKCKRRGK